MMGAERENVILLACVCLMLVNAGRDFVSVVLAILIWTSGLIFSRVMAKKDPWATKVYINSLQYQDFYPAREKLNTPKCVIKRKREF